MDPDETTEDKKVEKEKPNFGLSGKLTEETNTFKGIVIKYSEPPEARKPQKIRWRLYPFKGSDSLPVMHIHRQSAYLLGRERKIADIPIDHPSCSKQHAAIQYRLMPYDRPDGSRGRRIRPYIIDLNSANGTFVNGTQIQPSRYVELMEKDILKFGFSSREYVILHDQSKDIEDESEEDGSSQPSILPSQPQPQGQLSLPAPPSPMPIKQESSSSSSKRNRDDDRTSSSSRSKDKKSRRDSSDRDHLSTTSTRVKSERSDSRDRDRNRTSRYDIKNRSDRDSESRRYKRS